MFAILFRRIAAALLLTIAASAAVSAQERSTDFESWTLPGWSFTPSFSFGGLWDSNVGIATNQPGGRPTDRDTMFVFEPQGQLEFRNNRTTFVGGYQGYLRRYTEVDQLNGFDQRMHISLDRLATKRITFFLRNDYADVPTTDDVLLNGIPYARTGSLSNRFSAGIDTRVTKYDDLNVRYENTWVSFDDEMVFLRGGVMNAVFADYGRRLTARTTLGGEYSIRHASMNDGTRVMWFQDIGAFIEHALGPHLKLKAAGGYSVLNDARLSENHGGAYGRGELTHETDHLTSGVLYSRTFAPTFGFGGSSESQELRGWVHMPFSRNRFYVQSSAGWRRTSPLLALQELDLDTFVVDNTVGYGVSRWLRIEAFHLYTRQDSSIAGGEINRHRAGAQLVISQPMRIR